MYERFTDRARMVMQLANQEAMRFNHEYIDTPHVLLGLVKEGMGLGATVLKSLDIDLRKVRIEVEKLVRSGPDIVTTGKLPQTPLAKKVIVFSMEAARDLNHSHVGTEHLLLGLARINEGIAAEVFLKLGVSLEKLKQEVIKQSENAENPEHAGSERVASTTKSKTPALDSLAHDLTELAREGKLRPVIGRETEINRVATVLSKLNRQNVILVGDPGIGRRSIVHGLAHQIANKTVVDRFADYRLVELDQASLVSGTKYHGQLEQRVKALTTEMRRTKNAILFVPHIHLLARADRIETESGITAFETLKHSMIRDKIKCVGVCSQTQYESFISADPELVDLFQPVRIAPPTKTQTLEILRGIKKVYEDHHRVEIKDESLEAAIELSELYLVDRPLLSKAINLIDESGAQLGFHRQSPETSELDEQIENLESLKDKAVRKEEFEAAANYRSEIENLEQRKLSLTNQWLEKHEPCGTVDFDNVVTAVSVETGISEADIRARKNIPDGSGG